MNNTEHNPETFAQVLCRDLSADKAFVPLVAWHIRHQVDLLLTLLLEGLSSVIYGLAHARACSRRRELNTLIFELHLLGVCLMRNITLSNVATQVSEHRKIERNSTSRSALDPVATEKPQAAPRRTRRKASMKQPADAGFKSTYGSGMYASHCKTPLQIQIVGYQHLESFPFIVICTHIQVLYDGLRSGNSGLPTWAVQMRRSCLPLR